MGSTKRIAFLLLITCLQRSIPAYCQITTSKVTLSEKNAPLDKVLSAIRRQTGITFFGESTWPQLAHKVTINVKDMPYMQAVDLCFRGQPLSYELVDGAISIHVIKTKDFLLRGSVYNEKKEPVPGANIISKGTGRASTAITDEQGGFSIFLSREDTSLVFSSIAYETKELSYNGERDMSVEVNTKIIELAGTVVVPVLYNGYQNVPKETATGSYSQVGNPVIERKVSTSILDRLDGVTSSLIFNKNIIPGINQSVLTIRGRSTISGNPDPLIVVDNFPYSGDINNINPEDIETVTVLKDAAAASIWGAFSGNGVIVLTTKKGKYNQAKKWNFTTSLTVGERPNLYYQPILSSRDYIGVEKNLFDSGFYNAKIGDFRHPPLSPAVEILIRQKNKSISDAEAQAELNDLAITDTRKDLGKYFYQHSVSQQYALNFSGGGKMDHYFFSAGYNKDISNLVRNQYNRITLNGSNTWNILPKKLELTTDFTLASAGIQNNNSGFANLLYPYLRLVDGSGKATAVAADFRLPFVDTTGGGLLDWHYRPLDELRNADDKARLTDFRFNTALRYRIYDGLSANVFYQYQHGRWDDKNFQSIQTYSTRELINSYAQPDMNGGYAWPVPRGGIMDETINGYYANNIRLQLNLEHVFAPDHKLNALAGWELRDVEGHFDNSRLYGFDPGTHTSMPVDYGTLFFQPFTGRVAKIPNQNLYYSTSDRFISYYANAAYTFRQRYILSGSIRRDESNLFGVDANQKGVPLWSAGAAWELSKENFYRVDWLPFLKLRVTDGYNGNVDRSVSAYTTAIMNDLVNDYSELFATITNPPNPSLRWEKIGIFNVGLDFASKSSRVEGAIEYYIKSGKDLIGQTVMDPTTGVTTFTGNTANMVAHGFDLTLHSRNLAGRLRWNNDWLVSFVKDRVTRYQGTQLSVTDYFNATTFNPLVGHPLYSVYALNWRGLTPDTGDPLGDIAGHVDTTYSTILNASDSTLIYKGPANPPIFGSWRNTFGWGQFELSFNIVFKLGYYFRRNSIQYFDLYNGISKGSPDYDHRWQKPGDERFTNVPSQPSSLVPIAYRDEFYRLSEVLVEKGDHVRLQDIRISYDLPKKNYTKLRVQAIRFYIYANNIGILWKANHHGIDPDYINSIPNPRTLALGCKLEF